MLNEIFMDWMPVGIATITIVAALVFLLLWRRKPKDSKLDSTPPSVDESTQGPKRLSIAQRLEQGLLRTRQQFEANLAHLFKSGDPLSANLLEELHAQLYRADLGIATTDELVASVREQLGKMQSPSWENIQGILRGEVAKILAKHEKPLRQPQSKPWVVLVVGVNGVGKTTSVAKLGALYQAEGKKVLLGAADTFRAAAIDQLNIWGERLGVEVIAHKQGADPAAVAFDAVKAAKARDADVLIIDTAGRLHNKKELMEELAKVNRSIAKECDGAPHETWLVIDATTGQNALMQIKAFQEIVNLSGLIVTKLDGTAKGGVVVGAIKQFQVPIRYIGVGEKSEDLQVFEGKSFADSLF